MELTVAGNYLHVGSKSIHLSKVSFIDCDDLYVYLMSGRRNGHSDDTNLIRINYQEVTVPEIFDSADDLRYWISSQILTQLNYAPVITLPASSLISDTEMTVGATIDNGKLSTVWSVEYGLTNAYGSTASGGTITEPTAITKTLTGLAQNTIYHWRIKAVNSKGTTYTADQTATTTNVRWVIPIAGQTSGTATAGTMVISTTENITPTVTGDVTISTAQAADSSYVKHTITVNCPNNGSGTIIIPDRSKIKSMGAVAVAVDFYAGTNTTAPIVSLDLNNIPSSLIKLWQGAGYTTILPITGNSALPSGLTSLLLFGAGNITWANSEALPSGLTYIYLFGNNINWTGLNVGNGNIITFNLANYRSSKMSSADMLTFLAHLTNRTGTLPATITINDYADYASPPSTVTDAVAALKVAKPSVTTVNLGA